MKKEIDINERIESFLNSDLSPDESGGFMQRLETDPLLAKEVEQHKQLRAIITDGAYLNIKNELGSIHLQKIRRIKRIKRITGFGIGGFITCIIIMLIIRDINDKPVNINENLPAEVRHELGNELITENKPGTARDISKSNATETVLQKDSDIENREAGIQVPDKEHEKQRGQKDSLISAGKIVANSSLISTGSPIRNPVPDSGDRLLQNVTPAKTDCRKVKMQAQFSLQESCNSKPTGSIIINPQSLTGGRPPYTFSLNHERFFDTAAFYALYPGNYPVYAKDGDNCIVFLGTALIGSVDCSYQAVFAPMKDETWTVPVNHISDGVLQVFSKAGTMIYNLRFTANENPVWGGDTFTGQVLPMGIYQFEISYDDGTRFTGNVTIVR